MRSTERIVINTGPIIALVAALGNLEVLKKLYKTVYIPLEVEKEIKEGGLTNFAIKEYNNAKFIKKSSQNLEIDPILRNTLGSGEASVIQLAINKKIKTVCIDEAVGRRIARLYDLKITGSLGILLRAKQEGFPISVSESISRMKQKGIFLSDKIIDYVLKKAGEKPEKF